MKREPEAVHLPAGEPAVGGAAPPAPPAWQLLLLLVAPLLAYANSLHVPFTLDDDTSIVINPELSNPYGSTSHGAGSRQIAYLTFRLNYLLGGLDPFGYHVVNVAIHVLAGLAVFALARRVLRLALPGGAAAGGGPDAAALAGALLFSLHPVQTQGVTYVVQRIASLATLFYVAAMLLYVVARTAASARARAAGIAGAVVAAALAMRTKEIAFTLPFAIALIELAFLRGSRLRRAAHLAPFLLLLAAIPLAYASRGQAVTSTAVAGSGASRLEYAATQTRVVVAYLRLLAWPSGLNLDHDVPLERGFGSPGVVACLLLLLLLAAAAALALVRSRTPGVRVAGAGGLLFFLALSVESSFVPIADVMFEHRLYLPMAGAALGAAGLLHAASERWPARWRGIAAGAAAWLLLLGAATIARNRIWRDGVTLWSDVAEKSPRKPRAHYNLAAAMREAGDLEGARREWLRTLELDPRHSLAANQMGSLELTRGNVVAAEGWYRRALAGTPDNPEAHYNLAMVLESTGRPGEALEEYRRFVQTAPHYLGPVVEQVRARFGWR